MGILLLGILQGDQKKNQVRRKFGGWEISAPREGDRRLSTGGARATRRTAAPSQSAVSGPKSPLKKLRQGDAFPW
jgi:hypothetical protein